MGNNPSTNSRPSSASPTATNHAIASNSAPRREPRLRDTIHSQRVAAPPEPSLAQARGISTSRPGHSQSPSQSQSQVQSRYIAQAGTPSPTSRNSAAAKSAQNPEQKSGKADISDRPSKPVAVPLPTSSFNQESERSLYSDSLDASASQIETMSYHLTRPPRLPLPIEEEVHTPGSPILAPISEEVAIPEIESLDAEGIPRPSSTTSITTEDEEDPELPIDKTKPQVPTELIWRRGGRKVFVTGSIFQWNAKWRLNPVPDHPGWFSAWIGVAPGTHHIRFIVDGNLTISPDLPTTVDFGNNLVNYIEVSADDVPAPPSALPEALDTPTLDEDKQAEEDASKSATEELLAKPPPRLKQMLPQDDYSSRIPQFLLDLDKAEDSASYQYAVAAIDKLPTPPSLPGFLGKPILNAATPMKDDNSVLNMPNHTVLNHLATSSIKNNVLAVSGTTRYKRKYVTTIMYKPTAEDAS